MSVLTHECFMWEGDHQQLPEQPRQWLALHSTVNIFAIIKKKKKHLVSYELAVVHV